MKPKYRYFISDTSGQGIKFQGNAGYWMPKNNKTLKMGIKIDATRFDLDYFAAGYHREVKLKEFRQWQQSSDNQLLTSE